MSVKARAVYHAWAGKRYRMPGWKSPNILMVMPDGRRLIELRSGTVVEALADWSDWVVEQYVKEGKLVLIDDEG